MDRPARLTTDFVKKVDRKGRYGDGAGATVSLCWSGP